MKTRFFYPNKEGNIEFTREELEKLLNDIYDEGRTQGRQEAQPYIVNIGQPIIEPYVPIYYNAPEPKWDYTKVYCLNDDSIGRIIIDEDKITC